MTDTERLRDLARFLRSRRESLRPEDFGLAVGRRRTPGLRREEVAQIAGLSATWYIWLEQGRDIRASPHALAALARALRLSTTEQTYLLRLARPDLDWRGLVKEQAMPSSALQTWLKHLAPHPAYILNRHWQVVAINPAGRWLLGHWPEGAEWSDSLIARLFLDMDWRARFVDWGKVANSAVAQFRLAAGNMAANPVTAALVAELQAVSPDFAAVWADRGIAEPPVWQKRIRHPEAGDLLYDFTTVRPEGRDSDFAVSIYTPADQAAINWSISMWRALQG
jgi:transcriptional regulator with XRE-family HTH domain